MKIAIIPARYNSKRIKNKNIKNFKGKPIMSYAIKLAKESKIFDEIFVSTDSLKIAKIAKKYGASVPWLRKKSLSTDKATTHQVIYSEIKKISKIYKNIEFVCCLYPCTPLLKMKTLLHAFKLAKSENRYILPVLEFPSDIRRALTLNNKGVVKPINEHFFKAQLKIKQKNYFDAGQFYFAKTKVWLTQENLHAYSRSIILNLTELIDINFLEDWKIAENLYRLKKD